MILRIVFYVPFLSPLLYIDHDKRIPLSVIEVNLSLHYFKYKYDRIKKHRGHKRAVIAIARMMLTCLYHMFSKQEVFDPADMDYSAIPEEMYQKFQEQYDKNAIKRLEKRGFTIIPPVVTA